MCGRALALAALTAPRTSIPCGFAAIKCGVAKAQSPLPLCGPAPSCVSLAGTIRTKWGREGVV